MTQERPFLTAEWRYLLMVNYEIDPAVLEPFVPYGVELDDWQGKMLVSMVGFRFLRTRVLGMPIPFHRNFDEVNLRFYVRRKVGQEWRRGVVFVKEIVPKVWIARMARWLYRENYVALPMKHTVERNGEGLRPNALVEYSWRSRRPRSLRQQVHRLGGLAMGSPVPLQAGSIEEFITEHYWGYTRQGKKATAEYRVEHPAWRVWQVAQPYLLCDVRSMYGKVFEPALCHRPHSAFLAEGSPVKVHWGGNLKV